MNDEAKRRVGRPTTACSGRRCAPPMSASVRLRQEVWW